MIRSLRYHWAILQTGALPLQPDRQVDESVEHRCTVTLIWPEAGLLEREAAVLVDPCFTEAGFRQASARLAALDAGWPDVGRSFVTHPHADHVLCLPAGAFPIWLEPFYPDDPEPPLAGLVARHRPGHHPLLTTLAFTDTRGRAVCVAGDAVLDETWLRAWEYYWPNLYTREEIVQTWASIGRLLVDADVIIPGHGPPVAVTEGLLRDLLEAFPRARHAERALYVAEWLEMRLASLRDGE